MRHYSARQQFQRCLGSAYFSCLDPIYYLRKGLGFNQAYAYLSIFRAMEWKCVGGFQGTF